MKIKLKRLFIQNFKLFDNFYVEFDRPNLVVFDGPNGFGKTSFYDAVELFFTGRLRRYENLVNKVVDKRHSTNGSPYLNHLSNSGDLIIKGELEVAGKTVCLSRNGNRNELRSSSRMDKPELFLYSLPHFDSNELVPIENENEYLTELLGKDYISNFEYLNYIEQDENTYLLKCKDKDRKEAIGHLFNTSVFESFIEKLVTVSKVIGTLCGSNAKSELASLKQKLIESKGKFTEDNNPIEYTRLITWKLVSWDSEKLMFPEEQYIEWLGEDGDLSRLETFVVNFQEYRKDRDNKKLDLMFSDKYLINLFVNCWNFIDDEVAFSRQLSLNQSIESLLLEFDQGLLLAINKGNVSLSPQIQELLKSVIDIDEYHLSIDAIRDMQKNSNLLSQLIAGVIDSRKSFIDKFTRYEGEVGKGNSCPLCGYSWQDSEELKFNFDIQEDQLAQLINSWGSGINQAVDKFNKMFVEPIRSFWAMYKLKHSIDMTFVNQLKDAIKNRSKLNAIYEELLANKIDFKPLLNNAPIISGLNKLDELLAMVNSKKHKVEPGLLLSYFDTMYLQIFDCNVENIARINKTALGTKRKYIDWQYSLYQSNIINHLQNEYDKLDKQFKNATQLKAKITELKSLYETSLKEYQQNIIKNIEILFHIYSGRISQNYKGGLGLFIDSDKNGIRFLENTDKTHDAVFTMSSGQLAALVISFTLALNKRYSKNKLLFIDDPVQTLDEINIAGLTELLRNEFSDHQIFLSTHEDMMSAYIRYKFQKFDLKVERLSFKERQLSIL